MADPTDREQLDSRIEAAAKAIGCYSDVQWQRWQQTSKGQQAHDRAVAALAAADAVDPLRAAGRDRAIQAAHLDAVVREEDIADLLRSINELWSCDAIAESIVNLIRARAESLETS